jgi:pimeloyl-ACP methyl ester carboxylesterase
MRNLAIVFMLYFAAGSMFTANAQEARTVVYLIPGQGADARQFDLLDLDPQFEVRHIEYFTPEKGWKMQEFAEALAQQIDTTIRYSIVGVSLGGMLASEMGDFLHPEKIILISSAKFRRELPGRYTFQKYIPLHVLVPPKLTKGGAKMLQPIVEPDSRNHKEFFREMLNDKDPLFLKRTVAMIIGWERKEPGDPIVHIHGDKDHTIPIKNVEYDYLIDGGSHMMVYTRADEISAILNKILLHQAP